MTAPALTVMIVDDEPPARQRLQRLIAELPGWTVAGTCENGREALDRVGALNPAVVLLDIRMPGMTGIEAARHLNALERPPAVVFTTAYDEYALEAFESHAVGYLLKPVRRERLADALKHASRLSVPQLERLSSGDRELTQRKHIAVRVRDRLKLVALKDVLFFRADQKYVAIRHAGGEDLIEESLRRLADEFDAQFVRAHRNLLVAVAHVEALEKGPRGRHYLRLRHCDEPLPVSRRQLGELRQRLGGAR